MPPPRRHALSGFKYAQEGILHCFRTQMHMRFHFIMLVFVLLAGLAMKLEARDMLSITFATTLVIVMEMVNTAIEKLVDLIADSYNPVAKLVKDVSAAAVLLAALNAVFAGVLIFFSAGHMSEVQETIASKLSSEVMRVVIVGLVLLTLVVIISKLLSKTGTPWHGGIISGHSAIGFLLAMTIFFTTTNTLIAFLAILLAILVAQSRVEAGVHSIREVIFGAMLAILLTALVYRVMPSIQTKPKVVPLKTSRIMSKENLLASPRRALASVYEGDCSFA